MRTILQNLIGLKFLKAQVEEVSCQATGKKLKFLI